MADKSVPNLSSIILLVEGDGKSILLTGDCRGDHLKQGLIETGLSADGKFHTDIFKVPHHGSDRNTDAGLFEEVTADTYIISADGRYDNPDADVLFWIVEAAKKRKQKIKIVLTNVTPASNALQQKYEAANMGYELEFMPAGQTFLTIA
jgi:beta-lactamase superfamily II metal-dependent hydrolase